MDAAVCRMEMRMEYANELWLKGAAGLPVDFVLVAVSQEFGEIRRKFSTPFQEATLRGVEWGAYGVKVLPSLQN